MASDTERTQISKSITTTLTNWQYMVDVCFIEGNVLTTVHALVSISNPDLETQFPPLLE